MAHGVINPEFEHLLVGKEFPRKHLPPIVFDGLPGLEEFHSLANGLLAENAGVIQLTWRGGPLVVAGFANEELRRQWDEVLTPEAEKIRTEAEQRVAKIVGKRPLSAAVSLINCNISDPNAMPHFDREPRRIRFTDSYPLRTVFPAAFDGEVAEENYIQAVDVGPGCSEADLVRLDFGTLVPADGLAVFSGNSTVHASPSRANLVAAPGAFRVLVSGFVQG